MMGGMLLMSQAVQPPPGTGIDLWAILLRASWVSKGVLLVLLVFSLVSWAIILGKAFVWWRLNRLDDRFIRLFHRTKDAETLYREAYHTRASGYARVFAQLFQQRRAWDQAIPDRPIDWRRELEPAVERTTNEVLEELERQLGFLATTAGVAPFIGLFGTVLGIIAAFESIGRYQTADLSVVAPGIAEALVATAMGLAAAIPALIGYNVFVQKNRRYRTELWDFGSYVLDQWVFERRLAETTPSKAAETRVSELPLRSPG